MIKFISILILCVTFCGYSNEEFDTLNLELYITNDFIVFGAKHGFLRNEYYKYELNEIILTTTDKHSNNLSMAIYDSNNNLYLTNNNDYFGLSRFKLGDTIHPFSDIINPSKKIFLFNNTDYTEKPIKALEYISLTLYKIKNRYGNIIENRKLKLIINPKTKNHDQFINQIDSVCKVFNYKSNVIILDYKEGNESIKNRDLPDWGSSCCMDDSTAKIIIHELDSLSKERHR
jgi:hypothetical protein